MSLLGRPWRLHNIDDVEQFCRKVLDSTNVPHGEYEDTLAGLIADCWILSENYEPARTPSFSTFAYRRLRLRVIDATRRRYRTRWAFATHVYERAAPQLLSLDADDSERRELGASITGGGVDDGEHRLADQLRALQSRSRRPGGRDDQLGEQAA
jgi:Sigma-70 region 2